MIPSVIDTKDLEQKKVLREIARKALNIDKDTFIFGTVGVSYKYPFKAHDVLIDAFAKAHKQLTNTKLWIIGGGELMPNLIQQINRLGLTDTIKAIAYLPNGARYMSAFDAFILPSRRDACPKVLFESMVHKLPIITTCGGGIPEIMGDSTKLVPIDDIDALVNEMLRIYSLSNDERKELGNKIAQRLDYFTVEKIQKNYQSLALE